MDQRQQDQGSSTQPAAAMKYNRQEVDELYASDDFRIWFYKVLPCSKRHAHDYSACPFAHPGERAKRRCPRSCNYQATVCPDMQSVGSCPRGDACGMCHTVFEYWLHPDRYRTQLCKDGPRCSRRVCFFAHNLQQLRVPGPGHAAPPGSGSSTASPTPAGGAGLSGTRRLPEGVAALQAVQPGSSPLQLHQGGQQLAPQASMGQLQLQMTQQGSSAAGSVASAYNSGSSLSPQAQGAAYSGASSSPLHARVAAAGNSNFFQGAGIAATSNISGNSYHCYSSAGMQQQPQQQLLFVVPPQAEAAAAAASNPAAASAQLQRLQRLSAEGAATQALLNSLSAHAQIAGAAGGPVPAGVPSTGLAAQRPGSGSHVSGLLQVLLQPDGYAASPDSLMLGVSGAATPAASPTALLLPSPSGPTASPGGNHSGFTVFDSVATSAAAMTSPMTVVSSSTGELLGLAPTTLEGWQGWQQGGGAANQPQQVLYVLQDASGAAPEQQQYLSMGAANAGLLPAGNIGHMCSIRPALP